MRCSITVGVLVVAMIAVLMPAPSAFAQEGEDRLHILERHLVRAEQQLEKAHQRGDERAVVEAQVLVDALRLALDVERNLMHRRHRGGERPGPGADRPDRLERPEPRDPGIIGAMKEMLELDREIRGAMERGEAEAEERLRAHFREVSGRLEAHMREWLESPGAGPVRGDAEKLMNQIRELWGASRFDAAFGAAKRLEELMRKADSNRPDRDRIERPRGGSPLAGLVAKLQAVAEKAHRAAEEGQEDLAAKLRAQYEELAAMAEKHIRAGMERLAVRADDAHPRAEELLRKLGMAMERNADDAIELAKRLDELFGNSGNGPDMPDPDEFAREREREAEREREMAERERKMAELHRELAMAEARSMEIRAQIERLTEAGETERIVDLVAEHNKLRAHMNELREIIEKMRNR